MPTFPEVPTFTESGIDLGGISGGTWFGIVAPARTPASVITTLNDAVNQTLKEPKEPALHLRPPATLSLAERHRSLVPFSDRNRHTGAPRWRPLEHARTNTKTHRNVCSGRHNAKCGHRPLMSAFGTKPENICVRRETGKE